MNRTHCTYCDGTPVTLHSGKYYCAKCIHFYEERLIHAMLPPCHPDIERGFYLWAFNTDEPTFACFTNLYDRVDRGKWNEKDKCFDKPQDIYLLEAWVVYLKEVLE